MSTPAIATAEIEAHSRSLSVSLRRSHLSSENVIISDPASFDSRFVLPTCPLPPQEEFYPVEKFVANAVAGKNQQHAQQAYRALLDSLRRREDPPMLRKVLLALRTAGKGSTLHKLTSSSTRHAHLLHLLFRLDPFTPSPAMSQAAQQTPKLLEPILDYSLADAHLHLLLALVSANSVFLSPGLNALWRMVHQDVEELPAARITRVHAAVATMLRLCPKGTTELFPIMASNFPFRNKPTGVLVWYAKQCLSVLDYVPTLHGQVLELLIDKSLEIDVEIKIHDGGEVAIDRSNERSDDDEDEEELFQLDLVDSPTEENKSKEEKNLDEVVDEMADKLDSLMVLTLKHLTTISKNHSRSARELYQLVSPVFDSSILTTHRSKFVQFLVLFVCGIAHSTTVDEVELYREFAAKLIDIVLDPYRATITRQSGACYLASFVSRALYVCPETVCEAVSALLKWAEAYILSPNGLAARTASDLRGQCELHSLFYTVCQSAFYMMCFRAVDAMSYYRSAEDYHSKHPPDSAGPNSDPPYADLEHVDIGPERWMRICSHELQPLRFCLESVRGEFLHIASVFQLLEPQLLSRLSADDEKLSTGHCRQANAALICTAATLAKRRTKGGVGGLGRGSNPLDSFFPFDPYLLRRSYRFIEPLYRNWQGSVDENVCMDSDNDFAEDDESGSSSSGQDDDDEEEVHLPDSVDGSFFLQKMSHASNATITSQTKKSSDQQYGSPGLRPQQKQAVPREAWGDTLKRARAPSLENGSW